MKSGSRIFRGDFAGMNESLGRVGSARLRPTPCDGAGQTCRAELLVEIAVIALG